MKKIHFSLFLIAWLSAMVLGGDYIVVANSDCPISEVSKAELKRVYKGKVKDIAGTNVIIANLALDNASAESFLSDIVGMNSGDYKSFWLAQQIRGGSTAPLVKKTVDAMIGFVKESPNNIGYVPAGTAVEGVKEITVK